MLSAPLSARIDAIKSEHKAVRYRFRRLLLLRLRLPRKIIPMESAMPKTSSVHAPHTAMSNPSRPAGSFSPSAGMASTKLPSSMRFTLSEFLSTILFAALAAAISSVAC